MPSLVQYFDKHPTQSYSDGPEHIGVACTGFSKVWMGEYKNGAVNVSDGSSTFIISGSDEILSADSLSICFDSGSNVWAAVHRFNDISIFKYVSGAYQLFSFEGKYPQLLNDFNFFTTKDTTHCFYLKSGRIWTRDSDDNFLTERVFASGVVGVNRLTAVFRNVTDLTFYRYNLLCLDEHANGVCYVSKLYNSRESFWTQDFEAFIGDPLYLSGWNVEPKLAPILDGANLKNDSFEYESGEIMSLPKYNGYILNDFSFTIENFEQYNNGNIFSLSGYNLYSGFIIKS